MPIRTPLTAALLLAAGTLAQANPTSLRPSIAIAPTELRFNQVDLYRMQVYNPSGTFTAFNVEARLNVPPGMQLANPVPAGCSLIDNEPMQPGGPNARQVKCVVSGIGGNRTKVWDLMLRAPAASFGPSIVTHQAQVFSANVQTPYSSSGMVTTEYRNFSLVVPYGSMWDVESCWRGGSNGVYLNVPHGICTKPPNENIQGEVRLSAGGIADSPAFPGPGFGTWSQPNPRRLDFSEIMDPASGYANGLAEMQLINSRCFRGPAETLPLAPGQPVLRFGLRFCKRP
jgi:hypothetical protein